LEPTALWWRMHFRPSLTICTIGIGMNRETIWQLGTRYLVPVHGSRRMGTPLQARRRHRLTSFWYSRSLLTGTGYSRSLYIKKHI
jgi:hypothetical protein